MTHSANHSTNHSANRKVLISGASIAGPALAYWLDRYGVEVTVVEKAPVVRGGGYAIDIRGTARDAVDRMGLLERLREAHVDSQLITFLDTDGTTIAGIRPEAVTGGTEGLDLEVRRGDLADALVTPIRDSVEFLFNDSIATLDDRGDHVDVVFDSGTRRTFDLVIGADGLHSNTRRLVFGPEEQFHRYMGYTFAGFTLDNDFGLAHEGVLWNAPGRAAVLYAHEPDDRLHGFLNFAQQEPPFEAFRDPEAQRDLVASQFPEQIWHIPRLVAAMREADDLFFDVVSQIHMPTWSRGRVALVGDAAYATSFMSGQGSSVSLVGAYILAGELASRADHAEAFAAYERTSRDFVEQNQALVTTGGTVVAPRTQEILNARNEALRNPAAMTGDEGRAANTGLILPDYRAAEVIGRRS
ncbi:FAD-dependent monooxygenase [Streptomyces sp. NPDC057137]|uniref:FAD-dependent monooxygenase n=1 Tax=Streptomyces sp. NPDC057137 TaxID=3346030 RepID=UPI00362FB518